MQILGFIVVIGIALVIFYLFLRKLFNEDRLTFPGEKSHSGEKHNDETQKTPPEETPQAPGKVQPEQPGPDKEYEESTEKNDKHADDAKVDGEKAEQSLQQSEEIKM